MGISGFISYGPPVLNSCRKGTGKEDSSPALVKKGFCLKKREDNLHRLFQHVVKTALWLKRSSA